MPGKLLGTILFPEPITVLNGQVMSLTYTFYPDGSITTSDPQVFDEPFIVEPLNASDHEPESDSDCSSPSPQGEH